MELVEEKRVRPVTVKPAERSSWTMEGPRLPVPWGFVSLQESEGVGDRGTYAEDGDGFDGDHCVLTGRVKQW